MNTKIDNNSNYLYSDYIQEFNNKRTSTDFIKQIDKYLLLVYSPALLYVLFNQFIPEKGTSAILGIIIGVVIYTKYRNDLSKFAYLIAFFPLVIGLSFLYFISNYVFVLFAILIYIDYKIEFIKNY